MDLFSYRTQEEITALYRLDVPRSISEGGTPFAMRCIQVRPIGFDSASTTEAISRLPGYQSVLTIR